jgi:hypothetical protein
MKNVLGTVLTIVFAHTLEKKSLTTFLQFFKLETNSIQSYCVKVIENHNKVTLCDQSEFFFPQSQTDGGRRTSLTQRGLVDTPGTSRNKSQPFPNIPGPHTLRRTVNFQYKIKNCRAPLNDDNNKEVNLGH